MPVKIQIGDNSSDPRVISKAALQFGEQNFSLHYYYTHEQAAFGGTVIRTPWTNIENAVATYMQGSGTPEAEVAIRLVHCFNLSTTSMYLRMQVCKMVPTPIPPPPNMQMVYDLDTANSLWYVITEEEFGETADHELFDQTYLDNFFYKLEPQHHHMERLIDGPTKFVKNLVLPWAAELKLMFEENGHPEAADVNFAACSYTEPLYPGHSNVEWPHGLVIYLSEGDHDMLDNKTYIHIFHNKGADMSTLCPPNCNVYIAPAL